MNDASSRSHAVLLVMVAERGAPPEQGVCLYMIDLAGSERQKRSGVSGQGFSEMAPHTGRKATAYERRRAPPFGLLLPGTGSRSSAGCSGWQTA